MIHFLKPAGADPCYAHPDAAATTVTLGQAARATMVLLGRPIHHDVLGGHVDPGTGLSGAAVEGRKEVQMRILMVEADPNVAALLAQNLRRRAHEVRTVADGTSALRTFHWANLILLEVDLPDIDGIEVCREIRNSCDKQIIIVTSRGAEVDRVLGLQAGSDDYIVKPYSFPELVARIDAVTRRTLQNSVAGNQAIVHGTLRIDPIAREVRIDDMAVRVTRKEFDLLRLLASRHQEVISKRQIMSEVWDDDSCTTSSGRTIDTHVSTLRKKLGARGWIVTVRGIGFRMGSASSGSEPESAVRSLPWAVQDRHRLVEPASVCAPGSISSARRTG